MLTSQKPKQTIRVDILENFLSVLTEEEVLLLSQRLKLCRERAIERKCFQDVSAVFDGNGRLVKLTLTDDMMRPKNGDKQ